MYLLEYYKPFDSIVRHKTHAFIAMITANQFHIATSLNTSSSILSSSNPFLSMFNQKKPPVAKTTPRSKTRTQKEKFSGVLLRNDFEQNLSKRRQNIIRGSPPANRKESSNNQVKGKQENIDRVSVKEERSRTSEISLLTQRSISKNATLSSQLNSRAASQASNSRFKLGGLSGRPLTPDMINQQTNRRKGESKKEPPKAIFRDPSFRQTSRFSVGPNIKYPELNATKTPQKEPKVVKQSALPDVIAKNLDKPVEQQVYYHGILPRKPCEALLRKRGDFLVRITTHQNKISVVVSVFTGTKHLHMMTKQDSQHKYYFNTSEKFNSIQELISFYYNHRVPLSGDVTNVMLKESITREAWELDNSQIELKEFLGKGQFGEAYKGILTNSDGSKEKVAVKTCNENVSEENKKTFVDEASLMRQFHHENIIKIFGVALSEEPLMIVMELAERESLDKYLEKHKGDLQSSTKLEWVIMAANGMEYLESKSIIHRDLASRNCLLNKNLVLKISDFGLSAQGNEIVVPINHHIQLPIRWIAPESMKKRLFTSKSDVWSFGVMMWEIYAEGKTPYFDMPENKRVIRLVINGRHRNYVNCFRPTIELPVSNVAGGHLDAPDGTPASVSEVMMQCFATDPDNRPTFKEVRNLLSQEIEAEAVNHKTMMLSTLRH